MALKLWFRFGIPLGSATVLAALLDFTIGAYWLMNELGGFLYFHVLHHDHPVEYLEVLSLVICSVRFFLCLILWIFILLGRRGLLLLWIPVSIINDVALIGHAINDCTHHDIISDELWFLNIAVVILVRLYLTTVIFQALVRLVQNAKAEALVKETLKHNPIEIPFETERNLPPDEEFVPATSNTPSPVLPVANSCNELESATEYTALNSDLPQRHKDSNDKIHRLQVSPSLASPNSPGVSSTGITAISGNTIYHLGNIHRKCAVEIDRDDIIDDKNPRYLLMEPIGETPGKIFEYYHDTPRLLSAVLVIFELAWNIFVLCTRYVTEFLFDGRMFFMPKEEDIYVRVWRIVIGIAAVVFIFAKWKTMLRFWLIIYFWTIFTSLSIFVYMMAKWLQPIPIAVVVICTIWMADNILRFSVLYFCLRVTFKAPSSSNTPSPSGPTARRSEVNRSHSLRSQLTPRSKNSKASQKFRKIQSHLQA